MIYQKECNTTINCWSKDNFFDKRKKTMDSSIKFNYNRFIGTKNSTTNQLIELIVDSKTYYIPIYELESAIKLLKNIHEA